MVSGGKLLYSVSCNAKAVFMPESFPIAPGRHSRPLSEAKGNRIASYIQIGEGAMTAWLTKHYRVHQGNDAFARGKSHIHGIKFFRSYAKRRLRKFHGIPRSTLCLHLKKSEFRFNNRNTDIYKLLLKSFKNKPLVWSSPFTN